GDARFEPGLAERWNRMAEVEEIFDAVAHGDLAALESLLPKRPVPLAELLSHALVQTLDPSGRTGRRFGRPPRRVKPLELVEVLLAHRGFDVAPAGGDDLARFRHLQAMIEAYAGVSRLVGAGTPLHAALREATRDRFVSEIGRDPSAARLTGLR